MFWSKWKEEKRELEDKVIKLEREVRQEKDLIIDNNVLRTKNSQLENDLEGVRQKVREQNEADLYLSCAKIMKQIEMGKKPDEFQQERQYNDALRAQYFVAQQQTQQSNSFLQRLGLGSLPFGRL